VKQGGATLKKCFSFVLSVMFSLTSIQGIFALTGDGSASNPYLISGAKDWQEIEKNMRESKNWSGGKHFSLTKSLWLAGEPFTLFIPAKYTFNGTFNGNGHTFFPAGAPVFEQLGKDAVVKSLNIVVDGRTLVARNEGLIRDCVFDVATGSGTLDLVGENRGIIQDCKVKAPWALGITGLSRENYGEISRCMVTGRIMGCGLATHNYGRISHCRVLGVIKGFGRFNSGLVNYNYGQIENCTMGGELEGNDDSVYLVYSPTGKDSVVKKCVVGKSAKGATDERMFGNDLAGVIEGCGYEGWDQIDHCQLSVSGAEETSDPKDTNTHTPGGSNILGSATFGVMASAVEGFIKGPIEIVAWATPESGVKDFLRGLTKGTGAVSEALETLSPNPKVFKVAKIGTDIAGLFVGAKGLVIAVTKAGKAIKLGHAAESLKYMVSGGAAALARDVVFVAEGTALAEAAATGTASLLLAEGSSKTFHDDVTGGSGSKSKTEEIYSSEYLTPQDLNNAKDNLISGKDVRFRTKEQALDFIHRKFSEFPQEVSGARSSEGWHFDNHPLLPNANSIEHINIYSKKYGFRAHVTWGN
jgi:hypothetical protein